MLCACVDGPYVTFTSSLHVPHLSFFCCRLKIVLHDCGNTWLSSLIYFGVFVRQIVSIFEVFELVLLGLLGYLVSEAHNSYVYLHWRFE